MCIQRDVQERERALSLECNNVDVDALLYRHNKYIDDKFQTPVFRSRYIAQLSYFIRQPQHGIHNFGCLCV